VPLPHERDARAYILWPSRFLTVWRAFCPPFGPAGRRRCPDTNSILLLNSFIVPPWGSWHNQLLWPASGILKHLHRGLPTMTP
jgi:hypothetical protein